MSRWQNDVVAKAMGSVQGRRMLARAMVRPLAHIIFRTRKALGRACEECGRYNEGEDCQGMEDKVGDCWRPKGCLVVEREVSA